ncbi:hypothetical protein [Streptomyces tauricus]|uniref:hypothetical protein n=1 Tax=Streptomyces tauricus TaxID=68274 RepID=UPI0037FFDDAB
MSSTRRAPESTPATSHGGYADLPSCSGRRSGARRAVDIEDRTAKLGHRVPADPVHLGGEPGTWYQYDLPLPRDTGTL